MGGELMVLEMDECFGKDTLAGCKNKNIIVYSCNRDFVFLNGSSLL
jgi:hypothetical protein